MLMFLLASVLTIGGSGSSSIQNGPSAGDPVKIVWLGDLPPDERYSTRMLSIEGEQGIIAREDIILGSNDGGLSWKVNAKSSENSQTIADAWPTSSNRLIILSGGSLFESSELGTVWKPLDTGLKKKVINLAIAGDRIRGQVVLVGMRSVSITQTQLAELPRYAQDSSTTSPSMVVPAISISSNNGRTWQSIQLPKAIGYLDGVKVSGLYEVAWGPYAVYASIDGGQSWRLMTMDVPYDEDDAYPISAAIAGKKLQISLKNGRVLTGSLAGNKLSTVAHLSHALGQLTFIDSCTGFGVSSADDPKADREEDILMKTEDGGATWNDVFQTKRIVALSVDNSDLNGASLDRVFRIHVNRGETVRSCER
jgi:hypothetical protein